MRILLVLLLATPAACRHVPANHTVDSRDISVDGADRQYLLHVPTHAPATPMPLILLLHGHMGSAGQVAGTDGRPAPFSVFMDIAEEEGVLVAYLQGNKGNDRQTGWNDCRSDATTNPESNDVNFARAVVADVASAHNVDLHRVYASGVSNGGLMVLRMAVEAPDLVAAVAAVVAALPASSECDPPTVPVSVMFLNGEEDPLIPYAGGKVATRSGERGTVLSAHDSVDIFTGVNAITGGAETTQFPDNDPGDKTTVTRERFSGGTHGTQVVLYTVHGGGHMEPSNTQVYSQLVRLVLGRQSREIESAREIWAFFKDKQHP